MMFLLGLFFVGVMYVVFREIGAWNDRRQRRQSWEMFEAERRRRQAEEAARPDSDVLWWCHVSDRMARSLAATRAPHTVHPATKRRPAHAAPPLATTPW